MAPSLPTVSLWRCRSPFLSVLLILLAFGMLTLVVALAGGRPGDEPVPAKAAPALSQQEALEQFCKLSAEERLQRVRKMAKDGQPFIPVTRGDLDVTITGRGTLEAVKSFDVICMVRARRQDDCTATTIRSLIPNGAEVKPGDTLIPFDDSAVRKLLQAQTLRVEQARAEKAAAEKQLWLILKKTKLAVPAVGARDNRPSEEITPGQGLGRLPGLHIAATEMGREKTMMRLNERGDAGYGPSPLVLEREGRGHMLQVSSPATSLPFMHSS